MKDKQDLPPYLAHEHPLRLAHRGSTILWPENTMAAFRGATDLGCQYIETDLHMTRDGILVTFHDDDLERLTNGRGQVKDWGWQDLRRLDAAYYFNANEGYPLRGKGISIPSLEEVMETFPGVMFNLDLKQPGIERVAAAFINQHHYEDRVLVASFNDARIRRCRKCFQQKVATSAGYSRAALAWVVSRLGRRLRFSADALQLPYRQGRLQVIDRKLIDLAHRSDLQVHAWVVNAPGEMRELIAMGIDGIVTDRIDLLNEVLGIAPSTP